MWWVWVGCTQSIPKAEPPLRHEVYVWPSTSDVSVTAALAASGPFDRALLLTADARFSSSKSTPEVRRYPLEAVGDAAVGVVVRVASPSPFDGRADAVAALAFEELHRAQQAGWAVAEVQLDVDAPSHQLAGYRGWVEATRAAVAPVPVTVTALPDWLGQPELPGLLAAADGWVLQVHTLHLPRSPADVRPLATVDDAGRWVAQAARFDRPFRVALPTYAYGAGFDPEGKFLGVESERLRDWPPGTRQVEIGFAPDLPARLVRDWTAHRPPGLTGVLWFRLPRGDELRNARPAALRVWRAGQTPPAQWTVACAGDDASVCEVTVSHDGPLAAPPPGVAVTGAVLAGDGVGGYRFDAQRARFDPAMAAPVRPGERRAVGWVRGVVDRPKVALEP